MYVYIVHGMEYAQFYINMQDNEEKGACIGPSDFIAEIFVFLAQCKCRQWHQCTNRNRMIVKQELFLWVFIESDETIFVDLMELEINVMKLLAE